jgi:hypothetical protein
MGGGAADILEKLRVGQSESQNESNRNQNMMGLSQSENSSRHMLGVPEFSSRAMVPTSPQSRFVD